MSQRNNSKPLAVGSKRPEQKYSVVNYELLRRARHHRALRSRDARRVRLVTQLEAELTAFGLGCTRRGSIDLADMRHALVLQAQIDRSERAPQLMAATALVADREAACAALARWLYGLGGCWTQSTVASYLNERAQRTRRGRPWTQPSVSLLLNKHTGGGRR